MPHEKEKSPVAEEGVQGMDGSGRAVCVPRMGRAPGKPRAGDDGQSCLSEPDPALRGRGWAGSRRCRSQRGFGDGARVPAWCCLHPAHRSSPGVLAKAFLKDV